MTNEEAIKHVENMKKGVFLFNPNELYDTIINALKNRIGECEKYCDRNVCVFNEYNGIGCNECEVTKSRER